MHLSNDLCPIGAPAKVGALERIKSIISFKDRPYILRMIRVLFGVACVLALAGAVLPGTSDQLLASGLDMPTDSCKVLSIAASKAGFLRCSVVRCPVQPSRQEALSSSRWRTTSRSRSEEEKKFTLIRF